MKLVVPKHTWEESTWFPFFAPVHGRPGKSRNARRKRMLQTPNQLMIIRDRTPTQIRIPTQVRLLMLRKQTAPLWHHPRRMAISLCLRLQQPLPKPNIGGLGRPHLRDTRHKRYHLFYILGHPSHLNKNWTDSHSSQWSPKHSPQLSLHPLTKNQPSDLRKWLVGRCHNRAPEYDCWGDSPRLKPGGCTRIMFLNIVGLPNINDHHKNRSLYVALVDLQVDGLGMQEFWTTIGAMFRRSTRCGTR